MVTTRSKTPKKAGKPVLEELPDGKEPKKSGGGGSGKKGGLMAQYNTLMARYPLAMNMTQAGVLGGLANATEQLLKGKAVGELDFVPIMHFMIIPAFVMTPLNTQWFGYLFSLGLGKVPQLLVDSVFSSVVFNAVFSAALFTLQGNPAGIVEFVQGEFFLVGAGHWLEQVLVPRQDRDDLGHTAHVPPPILQRGGVRVDDYHGGDDG
mmetsp:Transcript_19847/g.51986  ORF Transcript_19847/g.51986 Transcript_19847/m.51986 type:complete len:207 (-) Transcript_19847:184-804(-)